MNTAHVLLRTHCIRCLAPYVNVAVKHNVRHPRSHEHCTSLAKACAQQAQRVFHSSPQFAQSQHAPSAPDEGNEDEQGKIKKSMVTFNDLFEKAHKTAKTKDSFNKVVDVFNKRDIRRRGHVEFIYAALRKMPEFGVQSDVTVYNKLLDVFPKEVFVPRNFIQRMFNHYPRQQECGVEVLEQMENYGVMPNVETKVLLTQIFGPKSHPMRKYQRIMYWFPKFKNANPFPVPRPLPEDPVDIAQYSLARIANDMDARVTVYQMPHTDIAESGEEVEEPHIVGIQSPEQQSLLARHDPSKPLFVEGPFPLWLRRDCVYYYVLKADSQVKEEDVDPELVGPYQTLHFPVWIDLETDRDLGDNFSFDVEDLEEGPVFAMCMVGRGDQATLGRWISGLQENNPMLGQVPTLFRLDVGQRELQDPTLSQRRQQHQQESHKPGETHGSHYSESEHRTEPDHVAEEDHGTQRVKQ